MSLSQWLLAGLLTLLVIYVTCVLLLVAAGRRQDARALIGFIPDCIVLTNRLLRDPRVPRSRKIMLAGLVAYLAMPIDLIPDFIPVAGQLDDVILVALVLRQLLARSGPTLISEHWPGSERALTAILRFAR